MTIILDIHAYFIDVAAKTSAGVTCQNWKCNDISRAVFLCLCFEFSRCRNKVKKNYLET